MDARLLEHIYTIDDIYELPEGTHAELIDGELFMMAAPSTKHQRIVSELHYLLKDFIKKITAPAKYFLPLCRIFKCRRLYLSGTRPECDL